MKYQLPARLAPPMIASTLLSALWVSSLLPLHAQTGAAAPDSSALPAEVETDAQALKKKARAEEQAIDDKIKGLEKTAYRESTKPNREALADYLESLARDSEKKDNWSGAWRYYQRAAAVLRDPAEPDWAQRATDDITKAASFRIKATDKRIAEEEAKVQAKRSMQMPAIVAPGFDWKAQKQEDLFSENRYREEVWKKVQSAWVNSEMRRKITDTSSFKKPAIISFDVHSDGEVSNINIKESSGDRRIDLAAQKVVEDLGKMDPLLPGMGSLVRFHTEFGK